MQMLEATGQGGEGAGLSRALPAKCPGPSQVAAVGMAEGLPTARSRKASMRSQAGCGLERLLGQ